MIIACSNTSGSTITRGQIVRQTGIQYPEQVPTVTLASASSSATATIFGVAVDSITNNTIGGILVSGALNPFDTSSFTLNSAIYLSNTAGAMSATPGTVESILGIAQVINASTGCILVGSFRASDTSCSC